MSDVKHTEERTETHECDHERTETHDLISRQAAIDGLNEVIFDEKITGFDAISTILDLPSAEQGQHGRWEFIGDQMFRCSECEHTFTQKFLEGWRESVHEPLFPPHCPSCGSYNGGDSNG